MVCSINFITAIHFTKLNEAYMFLVKIPKIHFTNCVSNLEIKFRHLPVFPTARSSSGGAGIPDNARP